MVGGEERKRMISGGNATVFVSNMDRSVRFYTEVLGLKLTNRFGDSWATVEAGKGLTIGLHPASPKYPAPGTKGAMMIGLEIDEAIDGVVARLNDKGARVKGSIVRDEMGNFVHLEDPDGNEIYLWETEPETVPATEADYAGTAPSRTR
jgi:predicted enzyme related to lactoylglutathione lyase